ncbi:flavodoxin [Slackia isoflavoniconvertens]|uniref:Flavodoxin n=1 Tax=Slackia isoflavoniconvertens TaxID=572010 RepID=A0A369LIK9_9ACTN|nr:flavodoxin [Slackia isoflavoniconvertens]RDB57965.1 flavodoxin [Slackia isoflavoniconvertens]
MQNAITRRRFIGVACAGFAALGLGGCAGSVQGSKVEPDVSNVDNASVGRGSSLEAENGGNKEKTMPKNGKMLIAYFSNTGNTEAVAEKLASLTGAELFRIEPETPYAQADLDYSDDGARCMRELNDPTSRPAISGAVPDWDAYDTVLVGYPIWWSRTPPIMETFVESHDWAGKTTAPFCTSGSSAIGQSASVLESETPGATWLPGKRFSHSSSDSELEGWLAGIGIE